MIRPTPVFGVQITNRDDAEISRTVEALGKMGFEWIDFGLIPFTKEITNLEAFPRDRPVIPLAGTKILQLWEEGLLPENWKIWYQPEIMDQFFARYTLRGHMLNEWAMVYEYQQVAEMKFDEEKFIKPTSDGKAFAGAVIPAGTNLREYLETVMHQPMDLDENVLVAPLQSIGREFRCFVVDSDTVAVSEYKSPSGIKAKVVAAETRRDIGEYVDKLPVEIPLACVDVCETFNPDGSFKCWKIVEINCFHCAGMYLADRAKVFEAIVLAREKGYI